VFAVASKLVLHCVVPGSLFRAGVPHKSQVTSQAITGHKQFTSHKPQAVRGHRGAPGASLQEDGVHGDEEVFGGVRGGAHRAV